MRGWTTRPATGGLPWYLRCMSAAPFNFSAGPATLPQEVFERAADAIKALRRNGHDPNAASTQLSILEHSHRGKAYDELHKAAEQLAYRVLGIPHETHQVLMLQGGASLQFAQVPMNLQRPGRPMAYTNTGVWADKAIKEAQTLGSVNVIASSKSSNHDHIPALPDISTWADSSYLHITSNNTIYGTEWQDFPETGQVPLVVDISSDIGSRPMPMERVALGYAGAQKNLGPSGLVLVFIRRDILEQEVSGTVPTILRYKTHAVPEPSLYHTPNTFGVLVLKLVLEWMESVGGTAELEVRNRRKAGKLYAAIDESSLFVGHAQKAHRSLMNVSFTLGKAPEADREALTTRFLSEAAAAGLVDLKGHRSVGGCRASIYNAFPEAGVDALVAFMREFERTN